MEGRKREEEEEDYVTQQRDFNVEHIKITTLFLFFIIIMFVPYKTLMFGVFIGLKFKR